MKAVLSRYYQEYIIEREGEYPTPVYHSVVSLDMGHDLYNVIHMCGISLFVQSNRDMVSQRACSKTTTTWPAVICITSPRSLPSDYIEGVN